MSAWRMLLGGVMLVSVLLPSLLDDEGDRIAALEAENATLRAKVESLEAELAWVSEQRLQEQLNFQLYQEIVAGLVPKGQGFEMPLGLKPPPVEPVEASAPDPGLERAAEMVLSLRNLFKTEGLFAMDLLEGGRLQDGALGPVVFRLLDDRGRLAGSLTASRMSLEAGRAGHTVTLILRAGAEHRAGHAVPFAERRIPLLNVDPRAWIAKLPELFPAEDLGQPINDGHWDLVDLRARLNRLLGLDAAAGYLRLDALEGVAEDFMFGVDFAEFDADGQLKRHLAADTLKVSELDRGVVLELYGCVAIRGGDKLPFPNGVHRVFLPRAQQAAWRAAKIPGLGPAPE